MVLSNSIKCSNGVVKEHFFLNQRLMMRPSIWLLHTKFQLKQLKNPVVMYVFRPVGLLGGRLVWLVNRLKSLYNNVHMLSISIKRLHAKFQPNWLKNAKLIHVFLFWAGRPVGW